MPDAIEHEKYYICLFLFEGTDRYRMNQGRMMSQLEKQLAEESGKKKIIKKKFFEIDRLTGTIEEF